MTIRKIMQFFFVLIATGLLAACGGGGGSLESGGSSNGSGSGTGTGTGTGTTKAKVAVVLSVEYAAGQSTISKDNPATAVAVVTKDGAPYSGVLVKFALSQAGIGSLKAQTTAETNASGRASVPLYAGSAGVGAGSFNVTLEGLSTTTYEVTLADAKTFNTQGDETTTSTSPYAIVLSVEYAAGQSTISKDNPATAVATVTKDGAPYSGVLVEFKLNTTGVGALKTQTTAQTNASGRASVPLYAGSAGVGAGGFKVELKGLPSDVEVSYPADKAFDTLGNETTTSTSPYAISLKLVSKADTSKTIPEVSQAVVGQVEITVTKNSQAAVGELVTLTAPALGRLSVTTVQTLAGGKAVVDLYAGDKAGADQLVVAVSSGTDAATAKLVFSTLGDETVSVKPIGSLRLEVKNLKDEPTTELGSSGLEVLELSAIVTDANSVAMADQAVAFGAALGDVVIEVQNNSKTNAAGIATARIKSSTLLNKTVELTAKVQDKVARQQIAIVGTNLSIENSNVSVSKDANAKFTLVIALRDSQGRAIANQPVSYSSKLNNITAATVKTNSGGLVMVEYRPLTSGVDEINASAFDGSLVATPSAVTVRDDDFKLSLTNYSNASGGLVQIPTNTNGTVASPDALFEVSWPSGTVGSQIKFESSVQGFVTGSGAISNSLTVSLDANKKAQVALRSTAATQLATIRATALASNVTAEFQVFIAAIAPNRVDLTAETSTVTPNRSSALTAMVKDVTGNPVANAKVTFSLVTDTGAGYLSAVTAMTNQYGQAKISYIGGASTATEAVEIQATVSEVFLNGQLISVSGVNTANIFLTVGEKAVSLSLAINLDKTEVSGQYYTKLITVQVQDSSSHPIVGAKVSYSASPKPMFSLDSTGKVVAELTYAKGAYQVVKDAANKDVWEQGSYVNGVWQKGAHWCQNEDYNGNQTLELNRLQCGGSSLLVSEDDATQVCQVPGSSVESSVGNGSGDLTPGLVGILKDENQGVTDASGQITLVYSYPKRMANWATVVIRASVETPAGDQDSKELEYALQVLASDIADTTISPPNAISLWGADANCRSAQ